MKSAGASMKVRVALAFLVSLIFASSVAAATAPLAAQASDPEMKRIFDEDQADRSAEPAKMDTGRLISRDAERRAETRDLLTEGRLHSGQDFLEAAFVFQHSMDERDYLLAHALAIIAVKKGNARASWIAAATLDRYLQTIWRKQIFGTQFQRSQPGQMTQDPYDRDLISDALRRELGVPDAAAQAERLQKLAAQGVANPTAPQRINCSTGPVERIFLSDKWKIWSCDDGNLSASDVTTPTAVANGAFPASIFVFVSATHVSAVAEGNGKQTEIAAATAAFQNMTPTEAADLVAQTKAVRP